MASLEPPPTSPAYIGDRALARRAQAVSDSVHARRASGARQGAGRLLPSERYDQVHQRYALEGITAEEVDFDDAEVPDALKHLIPFARAWGVGSVDGGHVLAQPLYAGAQFGNSL
jgi:hypothetical protein